jgi:hypothetical protein
MEWIIGWTAFSILAGVIASNKGRSFFGFFLLSLLLSPLLGIVAALIARPNTKKLEREQVISGEGKRCPFCAEVIRHDAIKCRFCGSDLFNASHPLPETESIAYQARQSIERFLNRLKG